MHLKFSSRSCRVDPFRKADEIIDQIPANIKVRFLDFHAELTSEKVAMGWYLMAWGVFTGLMFIGTLRINRSLR